MTLVIDIVWNIRGQKPTLVVTSEGLPLKAFLTIEGFSAMEKAVAIVVCTAMAEQGLKPNWQ